MEPRNQWVGIETLQNAAVATGNGTPISLKGWSEMGLQVTGITTATVTFEGTVDGTNYVSVGLAAVATGTVATSATADGMFYLPRGLHLNMFRARISAWTSGTITVKAIKQNP